MSPKTRSVEVVSRVRRKAATIHALIMENGDAPPGWVEVQRDDEADMFDSDAAAAALVVDRAGMPGTAILYNRDRGIARLIIGISDRVALSSRARLRDVPRTFIGRALVPAKAARICGMISARDEQRALREWT